jgi:hypothetical protein
LISERLFGLIFLLVLVGMQILAAVHGVDGIVSSLIATTGGAIVGFYFGRGQAPPPVPPS